MTNDFQNDIKKCLDVLNSGGTIIYPTDTIWGIGCDAKSQVAVERVFEIKQRDDSKSLIIFLENIKQLRDYVDIIPPDAIEIIMDSQRPTTIIYQKAKNLAENLIASDGTIGIRLPKDDFCLNLLRNFGKPIVSTSANISGMPAPQCFAEIDEQIKNSVDYIVKWRQDDSEKHEPSAIVLVKQDGTIEYLRK